MTCDAVRSHEKPQIGIVRDHRRPSDEFEVISFKAEQARRRSDLQVGLDSVQLQSLNQLLPFVVLNL